MVQTSVVAIEFMRNKYILKIKKTSFMNRLVVMYKGERGIKNDSKAVS